MLTALDKELFSNDCEVVLVPPHDLRIYLIHKNATSSLRLEAERQNWQILKNEDLYTLDCIDVFVREPRSRLLSGINTFVQLLLREHPYLDYKTCEFFACRYLFLNRHYLPQWHWILNLARFIHAGCEIRLHHLEDLYDITAFRTGPPIMPMTDSASEHVLGLCGDLSLWLLLDEILLGRCGQSLTWAQLIDLYRQHPTHPLDEIAAILADIHRVLR